MNLLLKLLLVIKTIQNFPTAIFDRLGLISGVVTYKLKRNNLKFIARSGTEDLAEIAVVASGSEYKLSHIKLPKKPFIVDLGAHIGTFSIPTSKILKGSKTIAYEPDEGNFAILKRNILLNNIKSIKVKKVAISNYVGWGYLNREGVNTDGYHLNKNKKEDPNCRVSTLAKEFGNRKIDLLKMDIEGGEYEVFLHKASLAFIKKKVHYLFMEYHNIDSHYNYSLIKDLIEKNFIVLDSHGVTLALENSNWDV